MFDGFLTFAALLRGLRPRLRSFNSGDGPGLLRDVDRRHRRGRPRPVDGDHLRAADLGPRPRGRHPVDRLSLALVRPLKGVLAALQYHQQGRAGALRASDDGFDRSAPGAWRAFSAPRPRHPGRLGDPARPRRLAARAQGREGSADRPHPGALARSSRRPTLPAPEATGSRAGTSSGGSASPGAFLHDAETLVHGLAAGEAPGRAAPGLLRPDALPARGRWHRARQPRLRADRVEGAREPRGRAGRRRDHRDRHPARSEPRTMFVPAPDPVRNEWFNRDIAGISASPRPHRRRALPRRGGCDAQSRRLAEGRSAARRSAEQPPAIRLHVVRHRACLVGVFGVFAWRRLHDESPPAQS